MSGAPRPSSTPGWLLPTGMAMVLGFSRSALSAGPAPWHLLPEPCPLHEAPPHRYGEGSLRRLRATRLAEADWVRSVYRGLMRVGTDREATITNND